VCSVVTKFECQHQLHDPRSGITCGNILESCRFKHQRTASIYPEDCMDSNPAVMQRDWIGESLFHFRLILAVHRPQSPNGTPHPPHPGGRLGALEVKLSDGFVIYASPERVYRVSPLVTHFALYAFPRYAKDAICHGRQEFIARRQARFAGYIFKTAF
jgi:hypothetical protein